MSSSTPRFDVNKFISLRLEDGKTNIYISGELFKQCKYLLLNIPIKEFTELEPIDAVIDKLDKSLEGRASNELEIPPIVEFWGHCSNLQVWAENNYDTRILHRGLAFPLLKRLVDAGDPQAISVFKKEIIQRLFGGYINDILYLISENYLKFFDSEERKIILKDLNTFLFKKLRNDSEFKRKVLALPMVDIKLLSREINLDELMVAKFKSLFKEQDEESFPELLFELSELDFMKKNSASIIFSKIPIDLFRFIVNTLEEDEDVLIEVQEHEFSIKYICFHILDHIRQIPPPHLNKWILSLLPDIKEPSLNYLFYKGFLKYLKYKDIESFLKNDESILYKYLVIYKNKLIFIVNKHIPDDRFWFTTYTFKKKLDLSSMEIENLDQLKSLEKISKLYYLDLSNNKIKDISPLRHLKDLEILDISGNSINDFGVVKELVNLRKLYISKSQINDAAAIKNLSKLEICVI